MKVLIWFLMDIEQVTFHKTIELSVKLYTNRLEQLSEVFDKKSSPGPGLGTDIDLTDAPVMTHSHKNLKKFHLILL